MKTRSASVPVVTAPIPRLRVQASPKVHDADGVRRARSFLVQALRLRPRMAGR